MAAYPETVVILSTRPEGAWYKSMMTTLVHHHANRAADDPSPMAPMARMYHKYCWGDNFPAGGLAFYREHNEAVRAASTGRKFLEYKVGSGWEPICSFLGLDVPEAPFPRSDDWVGYKKMVEQEAVKSAAVSKVPRP